MTTSPQTSISSELASGGQLSERTLAYLRERTRNSLYDFVLKKFVAANAAKKLTKTDVAARTGHTPDVVTRWLGAPGNWTIDTITDLLIGISCEELIPMSASLLDRAPRNYTALDWIACSGAAPAIIVGEAKPAPASIASVILSSGPVKISATR